MTERDDAIMAAMQASLAPQTETVVETIIEKVEPIIEKVEPIVEKVEPVIEKVEPVVEKVEPIVEKIEVVTKSFDEELIEKFGGKYKSVDEIKALLEKPEFEFADENIAHWNDLAKKGIKIDREFIELQAKDYESLDNPVEAVKEAMRLDPKYRGLSDKTLDVQLNKQYNLAEWINKDEADMTEDDNANRELLERDGGEKKQWLINYKNERVLEKQEDPEVSKALAREAELGQTNWEKFVETDLVNKITKLTSPVNDKGEVFDFDISEQDRKEVGEIMKALPKDTNAFFGQFLDKDAKGNITRNHVALVEMMLKARNYERAIALAYSDGASKEALRLEKESKNTNFSETESTGVKKEYATVLEALAAEVAKKKV